MSITTRRESIKNLPKYETPEPVVYKHYEVEGESNTESKSSPNDSSGDSNIEAPLSPEERRKERANQWKHAAKVEQRAQAELKKARETLSQVQEFQKLKEIAVNDPTKLAALLGLTETEFLRKSNNAVFNIKEEPKPEKPLTYEEKVDKYTKMIEEEREERAKQTKLELEEKSKKELETVKSNYIAANILPVLADAERFEIIHQEGLEKAAELIYDMMDNHYRATFDNNAKKGEILDINKVADEMENQLLQYLTEQVEKRKPLKKLSNYFGQKTEGLTIPTSLGEGDKSIQPMSGSAMAAMGFDSNENSIPTSLTNKPVIKTKQLYTNENDFEKRKRERREEWVRNGGNK